MAANVAPISLKNRKLKLVYFDLAGRALPIRQALVLGGLEFEDERITFDKWPERRQQTPYLQLPVLEIDGVALPQSLAILRLIGRATGMYPEDPILAAQVDAVLLAMYDAVYELGLTFGPHLTDEQRKEIRDRLCKGDHATVLDRMEGVEKVFQANKDSKWVVGDKMTVADLEVYRQWSMIKYGKNLDYVPTDLYDHLPGITEMSKAIEALPEVAKWHKEHETFMN